MNAPPPTVPFVAADGMEWEVVAAHEAVVRTHIAGRSADEVLAAHGPAAAPVKQSTTRATYRLDLEGAGRFYVKDHRPRDLVERVKYLVLPSRAATEWRTLRGLAADGLDVAEAVAVGEERRLGVLRRAVLVTRDVGPAERLDAWLAAAAQAARESAIRALAAVLARLHDAGWYHRDFHPGNILVRRSPAGPSPDDAPRLVLLDLHKAVKLPTATPRRARIRDAAQLAHALRDVVPDPDREAFVAAYAALLPPASAAGFPAAVAREEARRERVRLRSRGARCVRRSTGFRIERRGPLRIYRRTDVPAEAVLSALERHARAVAAASSGPPAGIGGPASAAAAPPSLATGPADRLLKRDSNTTVTRLGPLAPEGPAAGLTCVKEFPARGVVSGLKHLVRRHRGRQAWLSAHGLLVRGFGTPLPLALVEVRRGGLVRGSFLLTRFEPDAPDLHAYWRRRGPGGEAPLGRAGERALARALGEAVGALHRAGVYHNDLKWPNILVQERPPGPAPEGRGFRFLFLDLDAVSLGRRLTRRRRVKNLAQLDQYARVFFPALGRTHRLRFLDAYLAATGLPPAARADLAREIDGEARRRLARRVAALGRQGKREGGG